MTKFSYKIILKKINITIYFKNLTIELHIRYVLNTHVKFCVNQILLIISLYIMHYFKLQIQFKQFINDIVTDL